MVLCPGVMRGFLIRTRWYEALGSQTNSYLKIFLKNMKLMQIPPCIHWPIFLELECSLLSLRKDTFYYTFLLHISSTGKFVITINCISFHLICQRKRHCFNNKRPRQNGKGVPFSSCSTPPSPPPHLPIPCLQRNRKE